MLRRCSVKYTNKSNVSDYCLPLCIKVFFSLCSCCGCSSGNRMSCGGWRRSWPPRTWGYVSWSWSWTTWRTSAPTTSDLHASWSGTAASAAPTSDLWSQTCWAFLPFFSYITHVVISFWKFIKPAGQAWNTAGIWRRGKIYLLPPWNWWGHSLRSKLRFQIYFNPAHLTFSYFLHECWEWATALILISPKQKCFFF